jgi:hypothetical protein
MMSRRGFLVTGAALAALAPHLAIAGNTSEIATGTFRDDDARHRASGALSVLRAANGEMTVRMIDMQVADGPDLFVYLVKEPDPLFPEDVSAEFTSLGKLQSLTGTQDYGIPAGVDIDDWGSVVVWCASFTTTFAVATIKPTN